MNKQFVRKMVEAKRLEYQALKEIMPEKMANRVAKLEGEIMEFGKEFIMTIINDNHSESTEAEPDTKAKVKKVTIE